MALISKEWAVIRPGPFLSYVAGMVPSQESGALASSTFAPLSVPWQLLWAPANLLAPLFAPKTQAAPAGSGNLDPEKVRAVNPGVAQWAAEVEQVSRETGVLADEAIIRGLYDLYGYRG